MGFDESLVEDAADQQGQANNNVTHVQPHDTYDDVISQQPNSTYAEVVSVQPTTSWMYKSGVFEFPFCTDQARHDTSEIRIF